MDACVGVDAPEGLGLDQRLGWDSCCTAAARRRALARKADFRTREAATVFVFDLASPMMMVPSGTTFLTPGAWLSARASAAGIDAATALRSESLVICVAPTCFSWATSGACMDAAVAARACRWARFAGRLLSWLSNTTTMRSCLPAERALTWLGLSLESSAPRWPRAAELAAQPSAGHPGEAERGRTEQRSSPTGN